MLFASAENTDIDRGHLATEGEDSDHLQHEPKHVMDDVCVKVLKSLGTIVTLQEEGRPQGYLTMLLLQLSHLPYEH
jgi:hypothetical protein